MSISDISKTDTLRKSVMTDMKEFVRLVITFKDANTDISE